MLSRKRKSDQLGKFPLGGRCIYIEQGESDLLVLRFHDFSWNSAIMVVVSRFRATWGIEPGPQLSEWKKKLPEWKAHGYGNYPMITGLQKMALTIG